MRLKDRDLDLEPTDPGMVAMPPQAQESMQFQTDMVALGASGPQYCLIHDVFDDQVITGETDTDEPYHT